MIVLDPFNSSILNLSSVIQLVLEDCKESRAIQKRMDYTDEQRAAKPFENDFDIPEKGRQSAGIGAPWADHPTYIPDPLERVISGDPKQLEPGWGSAGKNDVERARWLLETGALGEHYREWKTAANEFGKANAAGNKPHTNFWGGVMDDIHQQIGDQGMDKMERSLDLPHPDVTKRWYQTEKALTRTRIDSASDIGTSLKYSNELTGLLGKNFSDLGHQDKNTLAKVEYALQQHGPEVLKPWSDMHIKDILSPEDYKDYYRAKYFGDKDPANFAPYEHKALDTTLANHQALIEQAKAHYAERAQRHFNLTPVGP